MTMIVFAYGVVVKKQNAYCQIVKFLKKFIKPPITNKSMDKSINKAIRMMESPAFKVIYPTMLAMGPFSSDPKINKLYCGLRMVGFSVDDTKELLKYGRANNII